MSQYYGLNELDKKLEALLPFKGGVFFEAGANDGVRQSNTYYFEKYKGWRGILVEPTPHLFEKCQALRGAASQCFNAALVPPDWLDPDVELTYCDLMTVTNSDCVTVNRDQHIQSGVQWLPQGVEPYVYRAAARTMSSIFEEAGVYRCDLLSLDIEGFEVSALKGMDMDRFVVDYLCIETARLDQVIALLGSRYELLEKVSHHDFVFRRIGSK